MRDHRILSVLKIFCLSLNDFPIAFVTLSMSVIFGVYLVPFTDRYLIVVNATYIYTRI